MERNGASIFRNAKYLTEDNFEQVLPCEVYGEKFNKAQFFDNAQACVRVLRKKYAGIVTGLWILSQKTDDGGFRAFVRTKQDIGERKFELHGDIGDFLRYEYLHRFTNDDLSLLDDLPVEEWEQSGSIYALFDDERGD